MWVITTQHRYIICQGIQDRQHGCLLLTFIETLLASQVAVRVRDGPDLSLHLLPSTQKLLSSQHRVLKQQDFTLNVTQHLSSIEHAPALRPRDARMSLCIAPLLEGYPAFECHTTEDLATIWELRLEMAIITIMCGPYLAVRRRIRSQLWFINHHAISHRSTTRP
jgi:hypothetical protein